MSEVSFSSSAPINGVRAGPSRKILVGGIVVLAILGWLLYTGIQDSATHYLNVSELKTGAAGDRIVRVSGIVVGETIQWDPQKLVLSFEVTDQSGVLPVIYNGVRPDMLRDGAEAVVEGRYRSDGIFKANEVLLKCPSKYTDE